jgi:hypothetical protein
MKVKEPEITPLFCLHCPPAPLKDSTKQEIGYLAGDGAIKSLTSRYEFFVLLGKMKTNEKTSLFFKSIVSSPDYNMVPISEHQIFEEGGYCYLMKCVKVLTDLFNLDGIKLDILQFDNKIYSQKKFDKVLKKWKTRLTSKE